MVKARLKSRIVFCTDVERVGQLLQSGLGFTREWADGGDISMSISVAGKSGGSVEYYLHPSEDIRADSLGTFEVENIDLAVSEAVSCGFEIVSGPTDTEWGTRDADLSDGQGHTLTLTAASSSPKHS